MKKYGLVGKNIDHSFSKRYFSDKFSSENIDATYQNFDLDNIAEILPILKTKNLRGLNVTIPYKRKVIAYLDDLAGEARKIGAVNTIKIDDDKRTIGYNTDCFGFMKSLFPLLEKQHTHALILGTGGASKAVAAGLQSLGIDYKRVSRTPKKGQFAYSDISEEIIQTHYLIINCTPLGTYPDVRHSPDIPYQHLGKKHLLYDLVYNPPVTQFLASGKAQGAKIYNGKKMLQFQADRAWEIWNER